MAARAFHLAAAAFAAGLLASIAVRGIGTAYVVGWESTWFADNPNRVAGILRFSTAGFLLLSHRRPIFRPLASPP